MTAEIVLCVLHRREDREDLRHAMLHGLQGLSLLHSLILEAKCSLRFHLGKEPFRLRLDWRSPRRFPWVEIRNYFPFFFSLVYIAVLSFIGVAFVSVLRGIDNNPTRIFIVAAAIISHGFLACFSFRRIHDEGILPEKYLIPSCILCFNQLALPTSVLVFLFPNITLFLLAQTIISFFSSILWIALSLFKFEFERKGRTLFPFISKEFWGEFWTVLVTFTKNHFRNHITQPELPQDKDTNPSMYGPEVPAQFYFTYWDEKICEKPREGGSDAAGKSLANHRSYGLGNVPCLNK